MSHNALLSCHYLSSATDEMRLLQRRLEETEAQMSRILQAMQSVQTNVDRISVPQPDEEVNMDIMCIVESK